MIPIQTARLRLRAFVPDDVQNLVALNADPAVREFLDMPEGTTPEQEAQWIGDVNRNWSGERGFWAAEEDRRFVGWFHLRPARDTGESRRVMEGLGMVVVREFLYDGRLPSIEYATTL